LRPSRRSLSPRTPFGDKDKIRNWAVNLAPRQYEELRGRYEFIRFQQDDLNKSIAELEEAITKINSTTRKKLRDAFDQLNGVSEVFVLLFSGGKAGLVLMKTISSIPHRHYRTTAGEKLQNISCFPAEKALLPCVSSVCEFSDKTVPPQYPRRGGRCSDESTSTGLRGCSVSCGDIQFIVVTQGK
jgi:hypothetical protein